MIIKSQIVLVMYDKLINHKQIYMNEIINEYSLDIEKFSAISARDKSLL